MVKIMANLENIKNIDTILTYILVKKLVTPIVKTEAYKLGLVDLIGKVIKEPSTPLEESALTTLDKVIFKMKRLLGSKLLVMNKFLYLQSTSNTMYDKLIVRGSILQRAEIKRIVKDVQSIQEKHEADVEDIIHSLLVEYIEATDEEEETSVI